MKNTLVTTLLTILATLACSAAVYEGFDISVDANSTEEKIPVSSGATSSGWMSTWQQAEGMGFYDANDLKIEGMESVGGSVRLRGEQMENHVAKGTIMRQIDSSYTGTVYASFRFQFGRIFKDSVIGLLFSIPSEENPTAKNSLFSFCPKRWGSPYGMTAIGKKVSKIQTGVPYKKMEPYLALCKLENLPKLGKRGDVKVKMWVLNQAQAEHFAKVDFKEAALNLAEEGEAPDQICQRTYGAVANSKASVFKGMIVSVFSFAVPQLYADEIHLSPDGFK